MQYCVKIFNANTDEFVGWYKDTGKNCITKMPNGTRWFNEYKQALSVALMLDKGFVRDKDKKYYTAYVLVHGDSSRQPTKTEYKSRIQQEEELEDALNAFIRQNCGKNEE